MIFVVINLGKEIMYKNGSRYIFICLTLVMGLMSACTDSGDDDGKGPDMPANAMRISEENGLSVQEMANAISNVLLDIDDDIAMADDCYQFTGNPSVFNMQWSGEVIIDGCAFTTQSYLPYGSNLKVSGKLTAEYTEDANTFTSSMSGDIMLIFYDRVVQVNQIAYHYRYVEKGSTEKEIISFTYSFSDADLGGFVVATSVPLLDFSNWETQEFWTEGELTVTGLSATKIRFDFIAGEPSGAVFLDKLGNGRFAECKACS